LIDRDVRACRASASSNAAGFCSQNTAIFCRPADCSFEPWAGGGL